MFKYQNRILWRFFKVFSILIMLYPKQALPQQRLHFTGLFLTAIALHRKTSEVCKVSCSKGDETLQHLSGARNEIPHRNVPVLLAVKREVKESTEVYLCRVGHAFIAEVSPQLLETCLEQGKSLGPDSAYCRLLLGRWKGRSDNYEKAKVISPPEKSHFLRQT